jgi:nitric oxide reductase NorD protein
MFEPDEYLFTKFAHYFKSKRKKKLQSRVHAVHLDPLKPRLTIFARAITGSSIELYEAEKEGGYKDSNFFLPKIFADFPTA